MLEKRANEGDDIPTHLDSIQLLYERLSGMGAPPSEDNYSSMIILSLPESYQVLLTTLGDATQQAGNPLNSNNYITKAIQEYERCHVCDEK
jgi:gag-polypeptide of LTR copia-type